MGETVPRHSSAAFVAFLTDVVASQLPQREIHVILDNLSTHKTRAVGDFLTAHPQVHLHFTPTHSSWLDQVELWFGRIERDLLTRGIFTSVTDLARQIRRYIRQRVLDEARQAFPVAHALGLRPESLEVVAHDLVQDALTGRARFVLRRRPGHPR
jgi:transposase